jgi:hypothetical protein
MAADIPLAVLDRAALGIVRQNIADRCPSESQTDVVFSIFNDGHDPANLRHRCAYHTLYACMYSMHSANTPGNDHSLAN